ncbi:MAG: hypothetical protein Q8P57_05475 [Candidatus Pacearchaeota archaeon]|nr:hypothetical protein [Candidatus Pacearchaeota archaeon]
MGLFSRLKEVFGRRGHSKLNSLMDESEGGEYRSSAVRVSKKLRQSQRYLEVSNVLRKNGLDSVYDGEVFPGSKSIKGANYLRALAQHHIALEEAEVVYKSEVRDYAGEKGFLDRDADERIIPGVRRELIDALAKRGGMRTDNFLWSLNYFREAYNSRIWENSEEVTEEDVVRTLEYYSDKLEVSDVDGIYADEIRKAGQIVNNHAQLRD